MCAVRPIKRIKVYSPNREHREAFAKEIAVEKYDCIGTLEEIRAAGKARFIGVSAVLPHIDALVALGVFDTFQIVYSALEPEHEATLSAAAAAGAGTIIRGGSVKGAPLLGTGAGERVPDGTQPMAAIGISRCLGRSRHHRDDVPLCTGATVGSHVHKRNAGPRPLAR